MTLQNGSGTTLTKLGVGAIKFLNQSNETVADPSITTEAIGIDNIIPVEMAHTFSFFKAGGFSDDAAMARAIAQGGSVVFDQGLSIHFTHTFTITKAMQFISNQSTTLGSSTITSSSAGGLFLMAAPAPGAAIAPVLFQGLNILNTAASGSIIIMNGDHTIINDCQFANVAGNSDTMVKFQGYDQVIENSNFTNYEPTAYCWSATWVDGYDGVDGEPVNDRIVGGSAFGPGKGGLISNAGLHFTEGVSVDDWTCATQGVQIQASDVYSLEIRGGVFDGATGSAIVLGGGNAVVQSVVIQGAYISAAGTAIDAAPSSGSGINDLTVQDNQISGAGTGITVNGRSGHAALIGNTITSSSLGLSILNPASQIMVIGNTVGGGGASVSDNSTRPNQVYFGNTISGPFKAAGSIASSVIFDSNGGTASSVGTGVGLPSNAAASVVQAVQATYTNVHLPNFGQTLIASAAGLFALPSVTNTFSHFKNPTPGTVLTDDQAFAAAIKALGAAHGTLVIDNGLTIKLTQTVDITESMAIVSEGSGLDTSSLITTSAAGGIFRISAVGSVLIQGLNLKSGSSGSIISTGTGNTVLRADEFTNSSGNASPMVVLQGPNQLIQDSYFQNNEATAYDWSAAYINPGTSADPSTTISGGWAYGGGKGGLIGGSDTGPVIQGFNIDNWSIVGGGATQIEARNVISLDIEGGVFDGSTGSAIVLGGGTTRINSVTVNGAFVSAAGAATIDPTTGIAINAGLATGAGVANLYVTDNQINTVGTGLLVGGQTGNITVSGNDLRTGKVGLDLRSPTGNVAVVGNQDNPNTGTIAIQSTAAIGSTQTYVANTFNGAMLIDQIDASPTLLDNIGSGATVNAGASSAVSLKATIASAPQAQVGAVPTTTIAALNSSEIAALTPTQLSALTPSQIGSLTVSQLGALTTAQLNALSPLQMVGFTSSQLAAMSTVQVETLMASQFTRNYLFDAVYYLAQNPDVAAAGVDPYQHYMTVGWKEGRNPSAFFNTNYYLEENPTVQAAGVNPLAEYAISGWKSGTDPSAAFSDSKYLAANPDVAAANMNPLLHYIISGQYQGRAIFASEHPDPLTSLTGPQIAALTAAQIAGLTSTDVSGLSSNQVEALTSAQMKALGATQLAALTPSQIKILTKGQLAGLTPASLQAMTAIQLGSLTPQQLGSLTTTQLTGLTHPQIAGLTTAQLGGFTAATLHALQSGNWSVAGQVVNTGSSFNQNGDVVTAELPGKLQILISEKAWQGDAKFNLTVDGLAVGGTMTAVASHAAGQSELFTIAGNYSAGQHLVGVNFLNPLSGEDGGRTLFVDDLSFDGNDLGQSASLTTGQTALLSTSSTLQSTALTFNLSEHSSQGDALAFISIDGKVQGGAQVVYASHLGNETQAVTVQADLQVGEHTATITLLNRISQSSSSVLDLFVDSVSISGQMLTGFLPTSLASNINSTASFGFKVTPDASASSGLSVVHSAPNALSLLIPNS